MQHLRLLLPSLVSLLVFGAVAIVVIVCYNPRIYDQSMRCTLTALKQLEIFEHHGMYKGKRYYFTPFNFNVEFNGVVATEEKIDFDVELIDMQDLLKE